MTLDSDDKAPAYYFGPFRLDPEAAELRRDKHRVELRPKCLALLLHLVEKPGKLLSRDSLLEQIWSDVVVGQETLSRTVTEIRQALGDDARAPQYIETVPSRGYKFIAPVTRACRRSNPSVFLVHRYTEYALDEGEHVLGRGDDVAIRLSAPLTSRNHARIRVRAGQVTLEDLGSKNGTLVNGARLNGVIELQGGDTIVAGGETLVVRMAADSTATAAIRGDEEDASR